MKQMNKLASIDGQWIIYDVLLILSCRSLYLINIPLYLINIHREYTCRRIFL